MRLIRTIAATVMVLALTASPALPAEGRHLVISNLKVPNHTRLQARVPYEASIDIRTPGQAVQPQKLCFFWNKDGPYCFDRFEMRKGADGRVRPTIGLRTGNPGKYRLTAIMTYWLDGKTYETNQTSLNITVR